MPTSIRLNKLIAQTSDLSRRAADDAIVKGDVTVNGETVAELGLQVNPYKDRVALKGRTLSVKADHTYIMFHKPRGCLVTKSDPQKRPIIWDHLQKFKSETNAVGRLDFDSEGLLVITSDGDLAHKLTHPSHEIKKRYQVKVRRELTEEKLANLRSGVKLREGITAPARVRKLKEESDGTWIEIEIHEGWNRQIRRMCDKVDLVVIRLRRISMGPLVLGRLRGGMWRFLKGDEIQKLKKL
jgi:23S rRNA pseudouridine2605 synthase